MNVQQWSRLRDWLLLVIMLGISSAFMLAKNANILLTFRGAALQFTARVEHSISWLGRYWGALDENEDLRQQNIELSSKLARSREAQIENERLLGLLAFKHSYEAQLVPARIISKEITRQENMFVIDLGTRDSVEVGMGVINERGILGKITFVGKDYSEVMSYLNTNFRLPAKIQPNQSVGIIRWEGNQRDQLLLEHVIKTEPVSEGELVVTSEFSGVFPIGYPIGEIESVVTQPGKNQYLIYIKPLATYDNAEHAFVIRPIAVADSTTQQVDTTAGAP